MLVVQVTSDLALEQAKRADNELRDGRDRGPLHGIPFGVKDLLATRGIATSWGNCTAQRTNDRRGCDGDRSPARGRSRVVRQTGDGRTSARRIWIQAGERQLHRAMSLELVGTRRAGAGGGSSSGPGSAVGAGTQFLFAIGSETWGSIMTPAELLPVSGIEADLPAASVGTARWHSVGRWTNSGQCVERPRTAAWSLECCIAGPDPEDSTCLTQSVVLRARSEGQAISLRGVGRETRSPATRGFVRNYFLTRRSAS